VRGGGRGVFNQIYLIGLQVNGPLTGWEGRAEGLIT